MNMGKGVFLVFILLLVLSWHQNIFSSAIFPSSGHSTKFHHQYYPPPYRGYPNERPEIAAAAQFVQYAATTGGKYKGSPYGNPRYQSSYDTSKRYYALMSVSIPIISVIAMLAFLPSVTNFRRRKRSLHDMADLAYGDRRLVALRRVYRAIEQHRREDRLQDASRFQST